MFQGSNIYYRFLDDSFRQISEFRNVIREDALKLKVLDSMSYDERVLVDRYRLNKREVNRLYGEIYSLKIACIKEYKVDPCKEAKKFFFGTNDEYIQYLLLKMREQGYTYNENIIEDVRNMYMRMADIEDKDFNVKVGNKIRITGLILSRKKKKIFV